MKNFILILLVFIMILSVFIFLPREWRFWNPKVDPLPNFKDEKIVSMYAKIYASADGSREDRRYEIPTSEYDKILNLLEQAEPTRIPSHTDSVYGEDYRLLSIKTEDNVYNLFVYQSKNKTYLEIPYTGVYRVDAELFEILDDYLF